MAAQPLTSPKLPGAVSSYSPVLNCSFLSAPFQSFSSGSSVDMTAGNYKGMQWVGLMRRMVVNRKSSSPTASVYRAEVELEQLQLRQIRQIMRMSFALSLYDKNQGHPGKYSLDFFAVIKGWWRKSIRGHSSSLCWTKSKELSRPHFTVDYTDCIRDLAVPEHAVLGHFTCQAQSQGSVHVQCDRDPFRACRTEHEQGPTEVCQKGSFQPVLEAFAP